MHFLAARAEEALLTKQTFQLLEGKKKKSAAAHSD